MKSNSISSPNFIFRKFSPPKNPYEFLTNFVTIHLLGILKYLCVINLELMIYKVAILGDFNSANPLHHAVNNSVRHVQKFLDIE